MTDKEEEILETLKVIKESLKKPRSNACIDCLRVASASIQTLIAATILIYMK